MQFKREIGRQFLIFVQSPFLGISFITAVRKLCERLSWLIQKLVYLCRGVLSIRQNFLIKWLLIPSGPAAVLVRVSPTALSSSSIEISAFKLAASAPLIFMLPTMGDASISGPKNSSIHPSILFFCVSGSLYKFS